MENTSYIESGILELYVFGALNEDEMKEVSEMAAKHQDIRDEILSIEKAVISLSFSMSPYLSAANFDRIRKQLIDKHAGVIDIRKRSNAGAYIGWAAAILLLVGTYYFYNENASAQNQVATMSAENNRMKGDMNQLEQKTKTTESMLAVVRDENNIIVPLGGQTVAPEAKARIYWNKSTQAVYVDASGLPEPPEGKEYQVWALQLSPQLVPTSIGLLADFKANNYKLFAVDSAAAPQGFGITLEPAGGSPTPTMEQLYTLGAIKA
ncbi:MAG: anti-sigma factor [Flavobacterium sp. BFFFF1]|uniref:anti-sigma factor n=1 Tax=unclassified Flavobacterium TaxID=196869 RepID=UPI000BD32E47|nr:MULTISPECIES: anti-sigma factor [unclassified Flavobacterium]OYU80106.1 MAG: anti-sigma factor [Flavobacterium sp. BFFFF1]